jgi:uncharacterized protein (TIGR00730 family)
MKVCVFGASSDDIRDVYVRETEHLGELMGQNDMDLVFGGGQHGLMGAAARGVRRSNGRVISISPFIFNEDDILFHDFSELYLTRDLIERKQLMLEISDSFVAVPGGIGTIDELFEVYAQSHLGYYRKPLILFNINGYFDKLWQFVCESHEEGFISDDGMLHCRMADSAEEVIRLLKDKNLTW